MDLLQNPFQILAASPRDNRRRIVELAEERSLMRDSSECMRARSELTNPRKRLSAEIAWLPDLSTKKCETIIRWLSKPVRAMPASSAMVTFSPVIRANVLAAGLQRLVAHDTNNVTQWILGLAHAFEDIAPDELCAVINAERVFSGFPEVTDLTAVDTEIQERRNHYRHVTKSALDSLSAKDLVQAMTNIVEIATDDGEKHAPILIDDLVDSYEVEAQVFLEKEEENIRLLVEKVRVAVDAERQDSTLLPIVDQLIHVVRNWDTVAQPIQVSTKSRGLDHEASRRVSGLVRSLAIDLFNEHGKLDVSQQLTGMLQEVFAEVVKVAELTAEDASTLGEIAEQRVLLIEDAKNRADEWGRAITYEADLGVIFKGKLRISPEGIDWKGRRWELDSIKQIRWGGTRHSVNGIPTGTTYSIIFGDRDNYASIELKNENIYSNFVDRLWKAVGVRLLTEYLEGLRDGKKYRFGSAVVSDLGMELERTKLFSRNEKVFCQWGELVIWNGAGVFCVGKKEDKKLATSFSYQNEDNIHVLEAAIRAFWKRGGDRLSGLLGE